jgi:FdhE protein
MARTRPAAPPRERLAAPGPGEAAAVFGVLLPLLRDAEIGAPAPALTPEEARTRLEQGRHLLQGLDLEVDADAAHELALRLARALEAARPTASVRRLREALERGDPRAGALLPHVARGERDAVTAAARARILEPDLLWTLGQVVFRPALRGWCRALAPLAEGIAWPRASCFLCGAGAALGELRADGGRHLRCGQCGASWRVRRLQCPSCGNEDHASLCTLYEEEDLATRRVEACDRCRRYLKVIAAAVPTPADALFLEDLATHHLDRAAQERGYRRGR